jgi:hypothetical protein
LMRLFRWEAFNSFSLSIEFKKPTTTIWATGV